MKLTCALLFTASMGAFATGNAQSMRVNIKVDNVSTKKVLSEIEKQTDYLFVYNKNEVDLDRKTSVNAENETTADVLSELFDGTDIVYAIEGENIMLMRKEEVSNTSVQQDNKKITGTVVDATGLPIIGANVMEKGTTNGTITDMDGNFTLDVPAGAVLQISYIGYANQEVKVGNSSSLSITLKEDTELLEEVVVVGYGTQTKSSLSSSVVEIKGDKLSNLPITNISRALDSYVPGLTASGTMSERPGESQALKIRGENSINNSEPLVLVDGIEGSMNAVNPNDVESISVLKDAASTAIYGARAAGGVILITTKKGKNDEKIKINYSGSYTNKSAARLPKKLDGLTYVEYRIKAEEAAGKNSASNHPDILAALKDPNITEIPDPGRPLTHFYGTASVDHIAEALGSANMHDHNISITGGSKKLSFLLSGSVVMDDALFRYGDFGFKKYNFRSNLDFQFNEKISLAARVSYTNSKTDSPIDGWDGIMNQLYFSHPNMPIKWQTTGDWAGNNDGNAIHDLVEGGHSISKTDRLDISGNLQVKILNNLVWNTIVGGSLTNTNLTQEYKSIYRYSVQPGVPVGQKNVPNSLNRQNTRNLYRNIQSYLTYNQMFKEKHDFRLMFGASYEDSSSDVFNGKRQDYLSNDMMNSLDLGIGDQYSGGRITEWGISSFFGRFNYNYNRKYFLEASFRSDGSSRFVKGKRWGFFPSVSASWRISEENFLKEQDILSDLKIRASWGNTGNQNSIGLYDYIAQMTVGGYYPFGSSNNQDRFVKQNSLASIERSWERLEVKNIALDFGFINNRLTGSFEYYIKNNRNMLIPVQLPSVIGINVPTFNAGELKVWGWEAMLKWQDNINNKFNYEINFSLSDSNNKIVSFEGSKNIISGQQNIEGYPIGSYFGYETDGLFQSKKEVEEHAFQHVKNDAGDVKYIDQNGDKKINDKDLVYLGNIRPRYVYNLGIRMQYAGFDMEMLFDGVGRKLINLNSNLAAPVDFARFEGQTDAWTPENPDAEWPRIYQNDGWNWWISDRTLHNAAYFSMKNFQLGYTLPKGWLEKISVDRLRVYLNIRNPFIIDNYVEYLDPRLNGYNNYPVLRSYTVGLNLTF